MYRALACLVRCAGLVVSPSMDALKQVVVEPSLKAEFIPRSYSGKFKKILIYQYFGEQPECVRVPFHLLLRAVDGPFRGMF